MTMPEVSCIAVATQNSSEWPCSMCPFPELRLVGVRTSYIYFSNISWTPWVLDPHYKSLFGALLLAYPVTVWHSLGILFQNFWAIKQSKLIPNCWPLLPVIVSCQLDSTKATKKIICWNFSVGTKKILATSKNLFFHKFSFPDSLWRQHRQTVTSVKSILCCPISWFHVSLTQWCLLASPAHQPPNSLCSYILALP